MADSTLDNLASLSGARLSSGRLSGSRRMASTAILAIEAQKRELWVEVFRSVAVGLFIALPTFAWLNQPLGGRVVWTVSIAILPLFIVLIGYYRWRRLCPLSFFGKLPGILGIGGKRTVPAWVEKHYHVITLSFFIFGLWSRHVAINGDGKAIAIFFAFLTLCAFVTGLIYTGKSWCNFICPVLFIEKIYTEPHGLRPTANSQCQKCTACKKFCPDINQENGYWKEIDSPSKKLAYYMFPGLVFGFYFYYYLQSGTWTSYFGDQNGVRWTDEPGLWKIAFLPGHDAHSAGFFFWQACPRALAALLTLLACGFATFSFFCLIKRPFRWLLKKFKVPRDRIRVRHLLYSIAGFCAFVTFYSYAGQPTLRLLSAAPQFFMIVVVLTAGIYLARRLQRTQRAFAEETVAKNIVKRWEWPDAVPTDLHDAFLIHTIRSKESERAAERSLEIYKEAVRDALAEGVVTREEMSRIYSLRDQLQIKKADHDKVMSALDEEARALLSDPSKLMSAEKRLQLDNYMRALENYLETALEPGSPADSALVEKLRNDYRVSPEEHLRVLEDLAAGDHGFGTRLAEAVASIERAAHTIVALEKEPSPAHDFLRDILARRRERAIATITNSLTIDQLANHALEEGLSSNDPEVRDTAIANLKDQIVPVLAERMLKAHRDTSALEASLKTLSQKLAQRTRSADPYERALAIYITGEMGAADEKGLKHVEKDEHDVVRNMVMMVKTKYLSGIIPNWKNISLSTVEKMIALRSTPIFSRLEPESLERLANKCSEARYDPGEPLCSEGDQGSEVFILVDGGVDVVIGKDENRKVIAHENAGSFIGEMAILDPGPRSATVVGGTDGVHVLRLDGTAFRDALRVDTTIAAEVIKTLAQRLKKARS